MARRKKGSWGPSRLQKLTVAYGKRFKSAVPVGVVKSAAQSGKIPQLENLIERSISEGRPNPEWEDNLRAVAAMREVPPQMQPDSPEGVGQFLNQISETTSSDSGRTTE